MEEQFDPGRACDTVAKVLTIVEEDMDRARAERDFECLQALTEMRSDMEPYAGACEFTKPEKKPPTC
jgi:hypothetical protein